jgi:uncharacterized cupredoxin-like copper-binding protein
MRALPTLLVAAALSAGCGSSGGGTSVPTGQPGSVVDVTLKDFAIDCATCDSLPTGQVTFHVTNDGPASHNLTVAQGDTMLNTTQDFPKGQQRDVTVDLHPGSYTLYCSVPGHEAAGMKLDVTVG